MVGLNFKSDLDIGNLLTAVAVLVAALTLARAWNSDRTMRRREQAERVRNAAARTYAKLERGRDIFIEYFRVIEPVFVDASDKLSDSYNPATVRDDLWRELSKVYSETYAAFAKEEIETAYADLFGYFPSVYERFSKAVLSLKYHFDEEWNSWMQDMQDVVLRFENLNPDDYQPPMLGKALRASSRAHASSLKTELNSELADMQKFSYAIITSSDRQLVVERTEGTFEDQGRSLALSSMMYR